ncbi:MAG: helix-turn-helix transcriptional regulator [Candidatus Dadabacteria bacterium]|nr:helix-turn-helix transcriptional regulator [Candidatus Dadabacteria bacterium]
MNIWIRNTEDLGRIVRNVRKLQKLSQDDLAGMAGTGRRFIVDLEKGKQTVQFGKVLRVLRTLGVSVSSTRKWY